jgi:Glutathione synthase/Ribosomal protein S6 modification enzyme (glutaminyl transferase)
MTIQMKKKHRVLLVPEEALYIAFRLPRILCCAGCEVDLLSTRTHPLRHSRYISKSITTESTETLFDAIVEELRNPNSPYRTIIVVPENQVRRLVATGDVNLLKRWQPGTVDHLSRELVLSKFGLEAAQVHKNMSIPLSKVCHSEDEVLEFGDHAGWPIICKPSDRAAGLGVVKLSSRDAINELSEPFPLLVQKFIEGQRGVTDMICAQGRPLAWLTSYSTRKARGEFGASTARLFKPMPELKPLIYEVAKLTRLEGFCGFDWIEESGTGRHYLIEIHPRPPSGFRFGRFCGVDLPGAVAAWLEGATDSFTPSFQSDETAIDAHYFPPDLTRCFRERDWAGLKSWLPGRGRAYDMFPLDDPLLFFHWLLPRLMRRGRR